MKNARKISNVLSLFSSAIILLVLLNKYLEMILLPTQALSYALLLLGCAFLMNAVLKRATKKRISKHEF